MIKLIDVTIQYDQKKIREYLNIEFPSKGLIGVFGKSGCGKSSLFQILAGVNSHFTGDIFFNNLNLTDCSYEFFKKNVTFIPQEDNCFEENTVEENILLSVSDLSLFDHFIHRYNLKPLLKQKMSKLSLGEHQRVSLVITFLQKKRINLLDEILCNLDQETKVLALEDLKKLVEESLVLIIAHQIEDIKENCDRLLDLSVETTFSLSSQELGFETNTTDYNLSFLKIKTYGNKVLKGAFIAFALMIMTITTLALNIATSSYTDSYMKKVIETDPLGFGVNIAIENAIGDYFDHVEIPFYDISLLREYYKDKFDYLVINQESIPRLFNFVVLEEVELSDEKICLKDMEVILPNEVTDIVTRYDEDGSLYSSNEDGFLSFNSEKLQPIVRFTEGNTFNFYFDSLKDLDLVIRKTYNRKNFYDSLIEYVDETQALKYSEFVILNKRTFIHLMSRTLNLQATLKTPMGDMICHVCPFELSKSGIRGNLPSLEDGEMALFPYKDNMPISKEELGYLNSSDIVTIAYKDKEYNQGAVFKKVVGFAPTTPLFIHEASRIKDRVEIYVTYNDFYKIMSELEYDLLEDMKPCNRLIDVRKKASLIANDIATDKNKIIFTNLPLIFSKEAFHTTKQIYCIVSACMIVIFFIGFFGYALYNAKELERTTRVMRYKMYSPQKRLGYIRFKNLFYPLIFSGIGILLGLFIIITGYVLNWNYFYSIQWQPYIIVLAEVVAIILIYFIMEKLKLKEKNNA